MSKKVMTSAEIATHKAKVANDKAANADVFVSSIVQQLDALSVKRDQWERTDYKKANEGLYALLSDCLGLFNAEFVNASNDDRKALREGLTVKLKAAGVKVQKNTNTLTMLVRYVFASDRKRAHGYAYVLSAAIADKIAESDLPAYIINAGGIEEIKRLTVKSEEAKVRQSAIVAAEAKVRSEVVLAEVAPLGKVAIAGLKGEYAVLLAKPGADGVATIVGALSEVSDAIINAMLISMAKERVKRNEENAQLGKEIDDLFNAPASNDTKQRVYA